MRNQRVLYSYFACSILAGSRKTIWQGTYSYTVSRAVWAHIPVYVLSFIPWEQSTSH